MNGSFTYEVLCPIATALFLFILVPRVAWIGGQRRLLHGLSMPRRIRMLFKRYKFLLRGSDALIEGYENAHGESYILHGPDRDTLMVTSRKHIQELDKAPRHMLSLHAVAKDFIQPKYTMNGFEWKDQRGIEGTAYVVAIHNLLTDRLHELVPKLHAIISETLQCSISEAIKKGDWYHLSAYTTAKRVVTNANCAIFFPRELAENPDFQKAAVAWPMDVAVAAEIIRLLPRRIGPLFAKLATRNHRSTQIMYDFIYPVVKEQMGQQPSTNGREDNIDLVSQVLGTMPKKAAWSPERLVGEIMAVWFGSLHTLSFPTTSALIDLCAHPDYIVPLRSEAESPEFGKFFKTGIGLPRIDSFLMESARLNLFEGTPIRRQALQDFAFSDGLRIAKGDWVSVPVRAMMRDQKSFSEPTTFDGRRFLKQIDEDTTKKASGISHSSSNWMLWGIGTRLFCPGRYYSSVILKLVIAAMVTRYECELEQPTKGSPYMQWRTQLIAKPNLRIRVKPRVITEGY